MNSEDLITHIVDIFEEDKKHSKMILEMDLRRLLRSYEAEVYENCLERAGAEASENEDY